MTRRVRIITTLFTLCFLCLTVQTYASEIARLYSGIRPLGMGNAFITLSDDSNAVFYNPAGLHSIESGGFALLNPLLDVGKNSIDTFEQIQDMDSDDIIAVTDFLEDIVGQNQHIRTALFTNTTVRNISIGFLATAGLDVMVRNRSNPKVITDVKIDYGPVAGFAFPLYREVLHMGISAKYIQREGLLKTFTAADIVGEQFDPIENLKSAKDFAFDVGFKFNIKHYLNPSIGLVVQNITDLDFEELGIIPQTINFGIGIQPKIWILDTNLILEIDDLTEKTSSDLYKRVHIGTEIKLPMMLAIRAGINQGWTSYGATFNLWLLKLDYANYAVEIGEFAGQKKDRRHAAQLSIGWNM